MTLYIYLIQKMKPIAIEIRLLFHCFYLFIYFNWGEIIYWGEIKYRSLLDIVFQQVFFLTLKFHFKRVTH